MVRLMVGYLVVMTVELTDVRKENHLAIMKAENSADYSAWMKAERMVVMLEMQLEIQSQFSSLSSYQSRRRRLLPELLHC